MVTSFDEQLDWWTRTICCNTVNLFPYAQSSTRFFKDETDEHHSSCDFRDTLQHVEINQMCGLPNMKWKSAP
jgi:hypothetical protein